MRTDQPPVSQNTWRFPANGIPKRQKGYFPNDNDPWLPCDPQGWIRVEDGLPPDDGKYIVHSTESYRDFWGSSWDATLQEWVHDMSHSPDPTHWQPAPQPPTKEGNDAD